MRADAGGTGTRVAGSVGAVGVGIFACPACWPLWVSVAAALGLGALTVGSGLAVLTVVLLAAALVPIGLRAARLGDRRIVLLAGVGAGLVLVGRFAWGSDLPVLGGAAMLLIAAWVGRRPVDPCCAPPLSPGGTQRVNLHP